MKKLLKKILNKEQVDDLRNIRNAVSLFLRRLSISSVRLLPERLRLIIRPGVEITKKMDYQKSDIFLYVDSEIEYDTRLHSCKKEPEMIEWIHNFFREGDIFYDVGANVGAYSLVASRFMRGKGRIYAFEPGFMNFAQLCKNILLNKCEECIIPIQIALSDKTAVDIFNYDNMIAGGALHSLGSYADRRQGAWNPVFKQRVLCYRMDDLIKRFDIAVPNHIKIDVDGVEFMVLKGAEELLKNPQVKSMILEIDEADPKATKEIVDFLSLKGLALYSKYKLKDEHGGEIGPSIEMYNYLFQRKV